MPVKPQWIAPHTCLRAGPHTCPSCHGGLVREHRRIFDRLHGLLTPLRRYRCENFKCQWVGNMVHTGADHVDDRIAGDAQAGNGSRERPGNVPVTFIVNMVLVVAGVLFVLFFSAMAESSTSLDGESVFWSGLRELIP